MFEPEAGNLFSGPKFFRLPNNLKSCFWDQDPEIIFNSPFSKTEMGRGCGLGRAGADGGVWMQMGMKGGDRGVEGA